MKKIITLIIAVSICQVCLSQTSFFSLFDTIDWGQTESDFVNKWNDQVVKTDLFHNEAGKFTREYILRDVLLGDYKLDFYINVHEGDKTLMKLVADFPKDESLSDIKKALSSLYGEYDICGINFYGLALIWFTSNCEIVVSRFFEDYQVAIRPHKAIVTNPYSTHKRYQLYPTNNKWIFLELDTVYGIVSIVQYTLDDEKDRLKRSLSIQEMREGSFIKADEFIPGRFELHKTDNMFNYILIDTIDGRTWQVQWSFDGKQDTIVPILQRDI
jgi:hypothetical protein